MRFFFLLLGFLALLLPAHALAQDDAAPAAGFADIPDEYIAEAVAFNERCEADIDMRMYKDCDCLASKYLDERIKRGPQAGVASIAMFIEEACPDATEAAGIKYQTCMSSGPMMPPKIPLEEFCQCYANTYAKLFEAYSPEANSRTFVALGTRAHVMCSNPEAARKLYPGMPVK